MSWLKRLINRNDDADDESPLPLDVPARTAQLEALERHIDALLAAMREPPCPVANPGWQGKIRDYEWVAGNARMLHKGAMTRESLQDVIFSVRPVFNGAPPEGLEHLVPLSDQVMASARSMEAPLPSERA